MGLDETESGKRIRRICNLQENCRTKMRIFINAAIDTFDSAEKLLCYFKTGALTAMRATLDDPVEGLAVRPEAVRNKKNAAMALAEKLAAL